MLKINVVELTNFKNYGQVVFEFHPQLNAFVGNNGMGKTNVLDALHMFSFTKSHFLYQDKLLVKKDAEFFRIVAKITKEDRQHKVVIKFPVNNKKVIEIDEEKVEKSSDYIGTLPLVFFAPDDEKIVYGGSVDRRKMLDRAIAQFDNQYLKHLVTYNRLLNHRNKLLNQSIGPVDESLLESYDIKMGPLGDKINQVRDQYHQKFIPALTEHYKEISEDQERIQIKKKPGYQAVNLLDELRANRSKDQMIKRTTAGIHKEDVLLNIENKPFKKFGSQGQIKSLLLAIRLAQLDIIKANTGLDAILIIDDIFDKLDEQRIRHLMQIIKSNPERQVFVSYTNKDRLKKMLIDESLDHKIFSIENGSISHEEIQ